MSQSDKPPASPLVRILVAIIAVPLLIAAAIFIGVVYWPVLPVLATFGLIVFIVGGKH